MYAGLALWSVASVTQLLSLGGIAVDINLMVWGYGLGLAGSAIAMIVGMIQFYARFNAYDLYYDTTKTSTVRNAALAVYNSVKNEELEMAAFGALVGLELLSQYRNWMSAQWKLLPEETRKEWEKQMKGDQMEMKDAMLALIGF
jgi:hypothetical protein